MINLANRQFIFHQSFFVSLLTILVVALFTRLGFWQLNRAEEKKLIANTIEQQQQKRPLKIYPTNQSLLEDNRLEFRQVELTGYFEPKHQFFLDNKKYQGKAGYEVITPFRLNNSQQRILINRGWVSIGKSRDDIPLIETPLEKINLLGRVKLPKENHFRPGISNPAEHLGGIWLYLDLDYFSQLADYSVYPPVILLDKNSQYGFVRNWPKFKAKTQMHFAYALQWFAFAFFTLLTYLWFGLARNTKKELKSHD